MSDGQWDPRIWSDGQMAEQCMKLGAVVLKPKSKPPVGFSTKDPTAAWIRPASSPEPKD